MKSNPTHASVSRAFPLLLSMLLLAGTMPSVALGQAITTGQISGRVIDETGSPVGQADVAVRHEPTGTVHETTSRGNGTFTVRSLRPGGPYTVEADAVGFQRGAIRFVNVSLGESTDLTIILPGEGIVELDEFLVIGSAFDRVFNPDRTGFATALSSAEVQNTPTSDRTLNSILRMDPRIVYNRDPADQAFSSGGINNRYNLIQVDGINASDPFGLNSNNIGAQRNVLPLDAIEAVSIASAPYDVRVSGTTGAQVNAVTRSGGNEISGSVYMYYRDDGFVGDKLDGVDRPVGKFEELTIGATLGGPIIKDTLFFFLNVEKIDDDRLPPSQRFVPDAQEIQQIRDQAIGMGFDPGSADAPGTSKLKEESLTGKIDWNINAMHRATFRYGYTKGELPNFRSFGSGGLTSFSSHWDTQVRRNRSYSSQLFSNWSPDLSSEISLSYSLYQSDFVFGAERSPQVEIRGVGAADSSGEGRVRFGTEQFRHSNQLEVETIAFESAFDYYINERNTLHFGFQYETDDVFNLFVQGSAGIYVFDSLAAFLVADQPGWSGSHEVRVPVPGVNPAAEYRMDNYGFYVQNHYTGIRNLKITPGIRVDIPRFRDRPEFNETFFDAFGERNDETFSGDAVIQPRVGFNYNFGGENITQIFGGLGLFYGKVPPVWVSNSFSNSGETIQSFIREDGDTLPYVADPDAQPAGTARDAVMSVNYMASDFQLPTRWKSSLGVDHKLEEFGVVLTAEAEFTWVDKDVLFQNVNLNQVGVAPDGRPMFSGGSSAWSGNPEFGGGEGVIRLGNTSKGGSRSVTFTVDRPMRDDGWFWRGSYTNMHVREVFYGTSSRAISSWRNRAVFDPNEDVSARGELEVKHRFLVTVGKEFEYGDGFKTRVALVYEGRSGFPFSLTYSNDANRDNNFNNDLIYVPRRGEDPLVRFADADSERLFFQLVDTWRLPTGTVLSRNSQRYPFVHQFDLNLAQEIPLPGWRHNVEITLNILNIGNLIDSSWGIIRGDNSFFRKNETAVRADWDETANQWVYSQVNQSLAEGDLGPATRSQSFSSRWSALVGVRYRF